MILPFLSFHVWKDTSSMPFLGMENALATAISHTCVCKEGRECLSQVCFQSCTE